MGTGDPTVVLNAGAVGVDVFVSYTGADEAWGHCCVPGRRGMSAASVIGGQTAAASSVNAAASRRCGSVPMASS